MDIRLNTPVTRVRWGGPGGTVTVETASGSITAKACIVTVSTGVLGSGALLFDPALPARVTEAIHALPMGLAMKVALRATGPDRLDLPLHCSVDRILERQGEPLMPFQCWPFGRDYVQGWIGGSVAWDLARAGEAAAVDFALSYLRQAFGGRVDRLFAGGRLAGHALGCRSLGAGRILLRGSRLGDGPGCAGRTGRRRASDVRRRGMQCRFRRNPCGRLDQRSVGRQDRAGGDRPISPDAWPNKPASDERVGTSPKLTMIMLSYRSTDLGEPLLLTRCYIGR